MECTLWSKREKCLHRYIDARMNKEMYASPLWSREFHGKKRSRRHCKEEEQKTFKFLNSEHLFSHLMKMRSTSELMARVSEAKAGDQVTREFKKRCIAPHPKHITMT